MWCVPLCALSVERKTDKTEGLAVLRDLELQKIAPCTCFFSFFTMFESHLETTQGQSSTKAFRQRGAGDILRDVYQSLTADPHSLANLDQAGCKDGAPMRAYGGSSQI